MPPYDLMEANGGVHFFHRKKILFDFYKKKMERVLRVLRDDDDDKGDFDL